MIRMALNSKTLFRGNVSPSVNEWKSGSQRDIDWNTCDSQCCQKKTDLFLAALCSELMVSVQCCEGGLTMNYEALAVGMHSLFEGSLRRHFYR